MRLTRRAMVSSLILSGCAKVLPRPLTLSIRADDGVHIGGVSYGTGPRGVVLVPGGHGIGETWDLQGRQLAKAGFRVLAMDYRGLGRLQYAPQDSEKVYLDLLGAVRHLKSTGANQIAVVGASWGGHAAGTAAIRQPDLIDRLVFLSHSPFNDIETLGGRKQFIVAAGDRDGSGRLRLDAIRDQFERAPAPKELIVLDGEAHAQFLFLTPQSDRLLKEITRFLSAP
jgi:pimeloyl-ACP methyl ester carboxylesterase